MSLLHFLFYCRSGGTIDRLVATSGGAQESRLEGGSQLLALRLADRLGDVVRLGAPVTAIHQDTSGVEMTHDGGIAQGDRAIVAIPPTLAGRSVTIRRCLPCGTSSPSRCQWATSPRCT